MPFRRSQGVWAGHLLAKAEKIDPEDQALLDEILHVLHRPAMRRVAEETFYESWPASTSSAAVIFAEEYGDFEHRFRDPALEEARAALYERARAFSIVEAMNGYPSRMNRGWRDAGYPPGEAEGISDRERLLDERSEKIRDAADAFVAAHDRLLEAAKHRGYSITAVSRGKHPRVEELDSIRTG